jgi:hypothetical protein
LIETSLDLTKDWLQIRQETNWTGPPYQSANRLAHLFFSRQIAKVPAWLVNMYFIDDRTNGPTDRLTWETALAAIDHDLGWMAIRVPNVSKVFLVAKSDHRSA